MAAISYSLCLSLFHSIWQTGILLLWYYIFENIFFKKLTPIQKRNFLLSLTFLQIVTFCLTFYNCFVQYYEVSSISYSLLYTTTFNLQLITSWIMYVYLFVLVIKLTQIGISWKTSTTRFYKELQKPLLEHKLFCKEKALHFGIKKPVKIWLCNNITTPITYGFLKPVIILPIALVNQLSSQQVEAIILHELSHIKANDYLLNWWLIIVESIFFFNPFIYKLCSQIRIEREKSCDMQVIQFNYTPSLYAEALLRIQKNQLQQFQLAAVGSRKHLLQRIQYFTKEGTMNYTPIQEKIFKVFAFLFFLLSIVFLLSITPMTIQTPKNFLVSNIFLPTTIDNNIYQTNEKSKHENFATKTITPKKIADTKKNIPKYVTKETRNIITEKRKMGLVSTIGPTTELVPVLFNDEKNNTIKEIIIKEETSGSDKTILKSYTTKKINGEWVLIPTWIAATNLVTDSAGKFIVTDTLLNHQ